MDPIKTNLKKAKKVLSNIVIRKSPQLFKEDLDYILKSNPNIQAPTGEESIMTPEEEAEGFVKRMADDFFGGNNDHIYLPNLLDSVRKELQENLLMPIEKFLKLTYIDEILNFYMTLESEIVEDEEGEFINEKIRFDEDAGTNQIDRDIYSGTLSAWKISLRQEILYLNNLKIKLSKNNLESKLEGNNKIIEKPEEKVNKIYALKYKSFQIDIRDSIEFDKKLKSFKDELEHNGIIEPMDYRLFRKVFINENVEQPIIWRDKPTGLYYLIKSLHDKGIIKKFKNYWQVACICFTLNDGTGRVLTPSYLQRCGQPSNKHKLNLLDSVIDPLE